MRNSHHDTQHPVRVIRGTGDSTMRRTIGQHWDRGPAGDETHWRHSRAMKLRLHGMGNRGRESTQRGDNHRL